MHETPTKVVGVEQYKEHDPRIVVFSKKSCERSKTNKKEQKSIKETTFEVILN